MNRRSVLIQAALAAAGLLTTYLTWQRQPDLQADEVIVLDLSKNELEKVRFEDPNAKSWSELVRDKDENGSFVAVRLSGSDATGVPMPAKQPSPPRKVPERLVRGNESAQKLFERFTPLRASRALGTLDTGKLKDLGLDTTKMRLEVLARGNRRRFAIVPAPPGGSDPYLRDEQDGRVYVVARPILTDMQSASVNLVERRLHTFRVEEIEGMVLRAASNKKEYRARRNDSMPGVLLAPTSAPDKPDETAKTWHDRIWNLFPSEVMGKAELPTEGAPEVAVRIEYTSRGRSLGWVELAKTRPPAPAESSAQPSPPMPITAYARTELTTGWVKLGTDALNLISEGESLARP